MKIPTIEPHDSDEIKKTSFLRETYNKQRLQSTHPYQEYYIKLTHLFCQKNQDLKKNSGIWHNITRIDLKFWKMFFMIWNNDMGIILRLFICSFIYIF